MFTDFVSITWDLLFSVFEAVDAATRSHLVGDFGHLRCLLCSPTAVSESWLCFQGDCKDLGRVKVTETSLSPLLLCRYSLLESSSLFFRKHWGLNAIYSRYIRSQMLIFLWHIPEAFVLTEEINAAPGKCGSLLLCGHAPHQPGGSQELCWFLAQFSCWNWILKLGTEWRIPLSNLKCLHCYPLRETWRAAWVSALQGLPLFLGVCNIINSSDGGVMFWIYLEFLLLFESLHFCFMNQIIVQFEFQAQTVCVWCVYSIFSRGFRLTTAPWPRAICSYFRRQHFCINSHHMCLENWCVSKFMFLW